MHRRYTLRRTVIIYPDKLYHYGVKGQKWGIRRYVNYDGTLTAEGKAHYAKGYTAREAIKDNIKYGPGVNNYINRQVKKGRSLDKVRKNMDTAWKITNAVGIVNNANATRNLVDMGLVLGTNMSPAARAAISTGAAIADAYGSVKLNKIIGKKAADKRRSKWESRTGWDLSDAKSLFD